MPETRVDGQHLQELLEPGSDDCLSAETKARIAEAIEFWHSQHDSKALRDDVDSDSRRR